MSMFQLPNKTSPFASYNDIKAANITGSQLSISGNVYVSGTFSGSGFQTDEVSVVYISGSYISGSAYTGGTAALTGITCTTLSGSTQVSGSSFIGDAASITDISGTTGAITGITCTTISGSTVSGSSYLGTVVTGLYASGSEAQTKIGTLIFTGSATISVTQSGNVITITTII